MKTIKFLLISLLTVAVVAGCGDKGPENEETFELSLSAPADKTTVDLNTVESTTFQWKQITGVSKYKLKFSPTEAGLVSTGNVIDVADKGSIEVSSTQLDEMLISVCEPGASTTVYWTVVPVGSNLKINTNVRSLTVKRKNAPIVPAIAVSSAALNFEAKPAAAQTVNVDANIVWTTSTATAGDWFHITLAGTAAGTGKIDGNGSISISLDENITTAERSFTLTVFQDGNQELKKEILVKQAAGEARSITVSVAELNFTAKPTAAQTVEVTANVVWTTSNTSTDDWFHITLAGTAAGTGKIDGNGSISISLDENTGSTERSFTLTVYQDGNQALKKDIVVKQAAVATTKKLLAEIYVTDVEDSEFLSEKYFYDDNDRIIKLEYYYHGQSNGEITVSYNADGSIASFSEKYKDDGEWTTDTYNISKQGNNVNISDGNNQPLMVVKDLDANGYPAQIGRVSDDYIRKFEYDTNGNITKESYRMDGIDKHITFTYDTKKAPFYNATTPKWFLVTVICSKGVALYRNNRLTESGTNDNGEAYTDNFSLTYDNDDYVITQSSSHRVYRYVYK